MFVGDTGLERIIRRSAELTAQDPNGDARRLGGIDLPTIQRFINFWLSYCLDLFGSEISTNAADYFGHSLKGRFNEAKRYSEHTALGQFRSMEVMRDGQVVHEDVPLRNAMNEELRDGYLDECDNAVRRWNKAIAEHGVDFALSVPHRRFHRRQGLYAGHLFDPAGDPIDAATWDRQATTWLPTESDKAYIRSLMQPCYEPGKMANWIAPPKRGINDQPQDFAYVRFG